MFIYLFCIQRISERKKGPHLNPKQSYKSSRQTVLLDWLPPPKCSEVSLVKLEQVEFCTMKTKRIEGFSLNIGIESALAAESQSYIES